MELKKITEGTRNSGGWYTMETVKLPENILETALLDKI